MGPARGPAQHCDACHLGATHWLVQQRDACHLGATHWLVQQRDACRQGATVWLVQQCDERSDQQTQVVLAERCVATPPTKRST